MTLVEVSTSEFVDISVGNIVGCSVGDFGGVADDSVGAGVGDLVVKLFNSPVDDSNRDSVVDFVSDGIWVVTRITGVVDFVTLEL